MDDLIRREDAMQRFLDEVQQSGKDHIHINTIKTLLDDVDVAYNVDKVVEQLENARQKYQRLCKEQGEKEDEAMNIHYRGITAIVKAGGVNG